MRSVIVALFLLGLPVLALPQSLGDAAARERARREKEKTAGATKAPRTYSNTDLGNPDDAKKDGGGSSAESGPVSYTSSEGPALREGRTKEDSGDDGGWAARAAKAREAFQAAQDRVQAAEERVNDLRRKLNPMSATYYQDTNNGDPNTIMQLRSSIGDAEAALADVQKEVAPAREAWEAFVREARANGAPPEALKPPSPTPPAK